MVILHKFDIAHIFGDPRLNGGSYLTGLDHFGADNAVGLAVAHPDALADPSIGHGNSSGIYGDGAGLCLDVYRVAPLDDQRSLQNRATERLALIQRALQLPPDDIVTSRQITLTKLTDVDHFPCNISFTDNITALQRAAGYRQRLEQRDLGRHIDRPTLRALAASLYR